MKSVKILVIATVLGSPSMISPASAAPITLGPPFLILSAIAANDIGRTPGVLIEVGANTVIPNGSGGTTGSAETTNLSSGFSLCNIPTLRWHDSNTKPIWPGYPLRCQSVRSMDPEFHQRARYGVRDNRLDQRSERHTAVCIKCYDFRLKRQSNVYLDLSSR